MPGFPIDGHICVCSLLNAHDVCVFINRYIHIIYDCVLFKYISCVCVHLIDAHYACVFCFCTHRMCVLFSI